MVGLDSLYAMLARPIQPSIKRKKLMVEETDSSTGIAADEHETPQSKLPQTLDRRQNSEDRRESFRGDRRKTQDEDLDLIQAEREAIHSPLPKIDIDV